MTPAERRRADGAIARAMSVQASRLYALLDLQAELDAPSPMRSADRDAPGAKGGA